MTHSGGAYLRCGHTMLELVTAMVASAMRLAGLGTVMLISRQIAYTPTASAERLEAAEVAQKLADDLRFASFITERSPTVLAFVVADRNDDGAEEHIRYEWSGTPGDPLYRTLNHGSQVAVLPSVQEFNLEYTVEASTTPITTTTDSAEVLLRGNTTVQTSNERDITVTNWSAQQINPAAFVSAPPANATHWNLTRIDFQGRKTSSATETLLVQLRPTGGPNTGPSSHVLGQVSIPESSLTSSLGWNSALFSSPVRNLALHRKYAIVWRDSRDSGSGIAARLCTDDVAATGVLETSDAGASWQFMSTRETYYRVYGTYTTPGPTYNVTRNYLAGVRVQLQTSSQNHSRIDSSVHLENEPELLSSYWRTDFDADPTTIDANGDDDADWEAAQPTTDEVSNPAPYDPVSLIGGVWYASGKLCTRPLHVFSNLTAVEVRLRDTSPGGSGAVAWINADWQNGLHAPLAISVQLQADGTQSLWLIGKPDAATEKILFAQHRLSTDFIRCRLTILPDQDLVNIQLNDEDLGTYSYPTYAPSSTDQFLAVYGDTTSAEFDYVEVRVSSSD